MIFPNSNFVYLLAPTSYYPTLNDCTLFARPW